ncbi:MAG: hypothetical protein L0215_22395 [Gemmataceae bacterium]|nr:hypothetical protein [Gemmataceae bacterium]
MVAGFHLVWTAYGYWLPNDPRGSWSQEIRVERIADLGEIHYGRKVVQPSAKETREFHEKAHEVLSHPYLELTEVEIALVAESFAQVVQEKKYTCYACAIMPDHMHLVIRKHRDSAEMMLDSLQDASRNKLIAAEKRAPTHPVWGGKGYKVFLYTKEDFVGRIRYVQRNPEKAGRPRQHWPFVKKYDGWMPGYWKEKKPS